MLLKYQCPNCSANLKKNTDNTYYCEYCGTVVKDIQNHTDDITVAGSYKKYVGTDEYVIIPNGVKKIEDRAFFNTGIVSVTLPDTLEEIGNYAFADCKYLKSITIPENVKKIGNRAFFRCIALADIDLTNNEIEFGEGVFLGTAVYMDSIKKYNEQSNEKLIRERKEQNRCVICGRQLQKKQICPYCKRNNI